MPRFPVPGADLAVELSDEGGPPVVQLHGLTSSRSRDRVLDLDLGRGLTGTRLLRYDARGHGDSSGREVAEDYRWSSLADDLLRLMNHWFPGEQVHGVGPSMGAATLLHAAVRAPDRCSGLTLLVPPTAWETRPAKAEEYRDAAVLVESQGVDGFIAAGRDQPRPPATADAPDTSPDVPERLLPAVLRGAALSDLPRHDDIARLDIPTRVLAWVDDPSHPVSTARTLAELLPRATAEVVSTPGEVLRWPDRLRDDVARLA